MHTCGIKSDDTVTCWGDDVYHQATPPANTTFSSITAGEYHTCGIKTDGTAACWGDNRKEQARPPANTTFTSIAAGDVHTCGIKTDGTAACWGDNGQGQAVPPANTTFTSIIAGRLHTCGIKTDGTAACWGFNNYGQATPPTDATFTSITAGDDHACGIKTDGTAACWGDNGLGRLGGAPQISSAAPGGGVVGSPYSHDYAAGPTNGPASKFTLTSGSLPPGLTLNSSTGALTGTPTAAGTFNGTVRASNEFFAPDATQPFSITIVKPNDPPQGTDNTVITDEDSAKTFAAADFGYSDPNDSPPDSFTAVKVATLPSSGSLKLSGSSVSANQSIPASQIPDLTYAPPADACGTDYDSFTFAVQDDGGTANGGSDTDPSPNTMTITVTCIDDRSNRRRRHDDPRRGRPHNDDRRPRQRHRPRRRPNLDRLQDRSLPRRRRDHP